MSNEKVMNRWFVVIGAILVQLNLGALYAWSVFTPYLKGKFDGFTEFNFTATQTQWIFSMRSNWFNTWWVTWPTLAVHKQPFFLTIKEESND